MCAVSEVCVEAGSTCFFFFFFRYCFSFFLIYMSPSACPSAVCSPGRRPCPVIISLPSALPTLRSPVIATCLNVLIKSVHISTSERRHTCWQVGEGIDGGGYIARRNSGWRRRGEKVEGHGVLNTLAGKIATGVDGAVTLAAGARARRRDGECDSGRWGEIGQHTTHRTKMHT